MKDTEAAFHWITSILERHQIPYKISGGFAARSYGVNRELADIDLEVSETDLEKIVEDVRPYTIDELGHHKDENWDLMMMTLNYKGQEIDVCSVNAKIFNQTSGEWEPCPGDLTSIEMKEVFGKIVPVESRDTLIAYKSKLARDVDVEDVSQLRALDAQT